MFDEARTLKAMLTMKKMTQGEIAEALGTSQSYVANKLRLLKLSAYAQEKIIEYGLTERHARALLRIKNGDEIMTMIEKIHSMNLPVAASDALIDAELMLESPKRLIVDSTRQSLLRFEEILHESIKRLSALGVKVIIHESYSEGKRFITMAIEDAEDDAV